MNTTITLEEIELKSGSHNSRKDGVCAMEAVAWLAGEEHSDAPECACPVISQYVIGLNDYFGHEERQRLKPYLSRILNTRDGNAQKRAEILAMAAVTKITPHAIELVGLKEEADKMREAKTLEDAEPAAWSAGKSAAWSAAWSARSAAWSAGWSAWSAGKSAAWSAAKYAAWSAKSAAWSAAKYAVESAESAEQKKAKEIKEQVIQEALNALDEILKIGK